MSAAVRQGPSRWCARSRPRPAAPAEATGALSDVRALSPRCPTSAATGRQVLLRRSAATVGVDVFGTKMLFACTPASCRAVDVFAEAPSSTSAVTGRSSFFDTAIACIASPSFIVALRLFGVTSPLNLSGCVHLHVLLFGSCSSFRNSRSIARANSTSHHSSDSEDCCCCCVQEADGVCRLASLQKLWWW